MSRWETAAAIAVALLLALPRAEAREAGAGHGAALRCDRLAASNDGSAEAPPVRLAEMDAPAALRACRSALASADAAPRHHLQIARALIKLGRHGEARAHLVTAAAQDNAAALYVLGQLHHTGRGVPETDKARAFALYRAALEKGYREAALGLLILYEDPASPHYDPLRAEATRLLLAPPGAL